jgi:predicted O-methyltransferase YrrM
MQPTFRSVAVAGVLERIRAVGASEDEPAKQRVRAREVRLARKIYGRERADLYGGASLAITPQVGELLYVLAMAARPRVIVEFGASLGFSTIFLASALRDLGGGSLLSSEFQPEKASRARENLRDAGLSDLVELRTGDAMETLGGYEGSIDLLFLDGWNDLYLPLLRLLESRLSAGALVLADLSADDPELLVYQQYVQDPKHGYV